MGSTLHTVRRPANPIRRLLPILHRAAARNQAPRQPQLGRHVAIGGRQPIPMHALHQLLPAHEQFRQRHLRLDVATFCLRTPGQYLGHPGVPGFAFRPGRPGVQASRRQNPTNQASQWATHLSSKTQLHPFVIGGLGGFLKYVPLGNFDSRSRMIALANPKSPTYPARTQAPDSMFGKEFAAEDRAFSNPPSWPASTDRVPDPTRRTSEGSPSQDLFPRRSVLRPQK